MNKQKQIDELKDKIERLEALNKRLNDVEGKLNFICEKLGYVEAKDTCYHSCCGLDYYVLNDVSAVLEKWDRLLEYLGVEYQEESKNPAKFVKKTKKK